MKDLQLCYQFISIDSHLMIFNSVYLLIYDQNESVTYQEVLVSIHNALQLL